MVNVNKEVVERVTVATQKFTLGIDAESLERYFLLFTG